MTLRERFERWAKRKERKDQYLSLARCRVRPDEYHYLETDIALAAYKAGFRAGRGHNE